MQFMLKVRYAPRMELEPSQAQALRERHDAHVRGLAREGRLLGIWRIAGTQSNFSLWQAQDAQALHEVLSALPLFAHLDIEVTPLALHPLAGTVMPGAPL